MAQKPKSLILLMPDIEARFFAEEIELIAPNLRLLQANSKSSLDAAFHTASKPCNLFGFCTPVIVPPRILYGLNATFNIHPGLPTRPGHLPTHKAHSNEETELGVTFHEMANEVDAGPIIATRRFSIHRGATLEEIESQTYMHAVRMAQLHLEMILGLRKVKHSKEMWEPA